MDKEAQCYMLEKQFKHERLSMLENSHCFYKTELVKTLCQKVNIQVSSISGSLTGMQNCLTNCTSEECSVHC